MYERLVVGTDGSDTATTAVVAAAQIACAHRARLCVTSAYVPKLTADQRSHWEDTPEKARWRLSAGAIAEEVVQLAVGQARAAVGSSIDVVGRSEPGAPVDVILGLVDELDADMVIVGNRGMTGLGRVRGSVARTLSRQAPCDVLIVDTVGALRRRRSA